MDTIAVPLLAAALAALGAYLTASRRLSGKIGTSEAEELWKESAAIRQDYREQLTAGDRRAARLEERVATLEQRNNDLARENFECERRVVTLTDRIKVLEGLNEQLREQVAALQGRGKP